MNRLADAEVAIVTEVAGTTRDVLRAPIAIDGIPVELIDTAGLRDSDDAVERIGIERARSVAAAADMILEIRDLTRAEARADLPDLPGIPVLRIWNKADLAAGPAPDGLCVSAVTGEGLDALRAAIRAEMGLGTGQEQRFSVRARHLEMLAQAAACLHRILPESPPDLIAEDLRLAERALEQLLGRGDHEALLGAIFAGFCIGK
jgi:tRNA modification GTPase